MDRTAPLSARQLATIVGPLDTGTGPTYRRLADRVRAAIKDGRITADTRLPSERSLAEATGLSRTTTTRAYELLREEGLLRTRQGSGSVVDLPLDLARATSLLAHPSDPDGIALTIAATEAPPGFAQLVERAMCALPSVLATNGYLPDGLPALRERLAEKYTREGLATDPEQIVVTSGAQGALSLLASALVRSGDRVLVEGCGYPHAFDVLGRSGARLVPLPLGRTPWPVEDIARLAPAVRLALLVVDFHNPTGALMESADRAQVAGLLAANGVTTIIDETMRDVSLSDRELPEHFARHDPDAIVVGSAAKWLWGGLRIGWIRAPHALVPRLVQARMIRDLGTAAIDQVVAAAALTGDEIDHAARRAELRRRRDTLAAAVGRRLPSWRVHVPDGGLSLWVTLPEAVSSALTVAAEAEGVALTPGPRFFPTLPAVGERHLRLPFSLPPDRLEDAVDRLARAWDRVGAAASVTCDPDAVNLIA